MHSKVSLQAEGKEWAKGDKQGENKMKQNKERQYVIREWAV